MIDLSFGIPLEERFSARFSCNPLPPELPYLPANMLSLYEICAGYHATHLARAERALSRGDLPRMWVESKMCEAAADACALAEKLTKRAILSQNGSKPSDSPEGRTVETTKQNDYQSH